jgi:hypothetical protein
LRMDLSTPIKTVSKHTSSLYNQTYWQFITNYLSNRSATTLKSIFTISRPPSQQNSINTLTPYSKYIYSPQRKISYCTRTTCRKSSPNNLTCQKCQNRSPQKEWLICTTWQNWFFEQQFSPILKWLLYTKKSKNSRSLSSLHSCHYFTFNKS